MHSERRTYFAALRTGNIVSPREAMFSRVKLVFRVIILACLHSFVSSDAQGINDILNSFSHNVLG